MSENLKSTVKHFADDTSIFHVVKDPDTFAGDTSIFHVVKDPNTFADDTSIFHVVKDPNTFAEISMTLLEFLNGRTDGKCHLIRTL